MGCRLQEGLLILNAEAIGEVRGKDLMVGINLVKDRNAREKFSSPLTPRVVELAYEKGLITRPLLAGDILQLSPSLVITAEEIDNFFNIYASALAEAYNEATG